MKSIQKCTNALAPLAAVLMTATGAHAASTNKVFISGPLILLFLGFCALIVVIQCIPAIIMLYSMVKGAASKKENAAANGRYN